MTARNAAVMQLGGEHIGLKGGTETMAKTTGIGWTDSVFNAWVGCTEAGLGCDLCYARSLAFRYQWGTPGPIAKENRAAGINPLWGPGAPRYRTAPGNWRGPVLWNAQAKALGKPRKVFCNSLSDVFDNEVPQQWRDDLFDLWAATPWLRWQVVTKRIGNVPKMLKDALPPNVGLVVTTVNQEEFDRDRGKLFAVPAAWHGFSIEPQIGRIILPVSMAMHPGSIWVITGGESNQAGVKDEHGAPIVPRPYDPQWAAGLIDCANVSTNIRVFVKQTGASPIGLPAPRDGAGADPRPGRRGCAASSSFPNWCADDDL